MVKRLSFMRHIRNRVANACNTKNSVWVISKERGDRIHRYKSEDFLFEAVYGRRKKKVYLKVTCGAYTEVVVLKKLITLVVCNRVGWGNENSETRGMVDKIVGGAEVAYDVTMSVKYNR